jgi:ribosomal protein S18 acetylase RimI-like enzyme
MNEENVSIVPVNAARWNDFSRLLKPCWGCWCMYYRTRAADFKAMGSSGRCEGMRNLIESGVSTGLIAYSESNPIGWISLGPKTDFVRLKTSRTAKTPDAEGLWSIVCFYIHPDFRHRGIEKRLIEGGIAFSKTNGARILEAYPVSYESGGGNSDEWYQGAASTFMRCGFAVTERKTPKRVVVRLRLE